MRDTEKIVFATSVLGASHVKDNKPCQDYSIAWRSEDSGAVVLIVCDGHGSDTYVRSDVGSRLAAEITLVAVKEFVPYKGHTPNPEWIVGLQGKVQAHEKVTCDVWRGNDNGVGGLGLVNGGGKVALFAPIRIDLVLKFTGGLGFR